jgi:hypothetical protein
MIVLVILFVDILIHQDSPILNLQLRRELFFAKYIFKDVFSYTLYETFSAFGIYFRFWLCSWSN